MVSKRYKKPKLQKKPPDKKTIRVREKPESTNNQTISWQFSILDLDVKCSWSCKNIDSKVLWQRIYKRVKSLEGMTWGAIEANKKKNHKVPINKIRRKARRRLRELGQDDIDDIFVIHFAGKKCLWGIREGRAFKIIWWDPNHEVCPANLKHT